MYKNVENEEKMRNLVYCKSENNMTVVQFMVFN